MVNKGMTEEGEQEVWISPFSITHLLSVVILPLGPYVPNHNVLFDVQPSRTDGRTGGGQKFPSLSSLTCLVCVICSSPPHRL